MKKYLAAVLCAGLALTAVPAFATTTTVTEFQLLPGDFRAYPNDVNSDYEMVGVSSNNSGEKAVLWRDAADLPELLPPPSSLPAGGSVAMAIADDGTIVGNQYYSVVSPNQVVTTYYVALVWNRNADNTYAEAELLPFPDTLKNPHAEEINVDGIIVGSASVVGSFGAVPVLWEPNGAGYDFVQLQKLSGAFSCNANDINSAGVIVGTCDATAVRWIPDAGGAYGAPSALTGKSGNATANNDSNVTVGAAKGNPARWSATGALSAPFGNLGGNSIDVNNQGWILARKSSGSDFYLYNGSTTSNLSTAIAAALPGYLSSSSGGAISDNVGGIVLVGASAYVRRTGFTGYVPLLVEIDTNYT